jgi:hypothetical protein
VQVRLHDSVVAAGPSDTPWFGRDETADLRVTTPDDVSVSRRAGELRYDDFAWRVTNTGRRSFFVVEAGREIELLPDALDRSTHLVFHADTWLRIPAAAGDVALVLDVPEEERPDPTSLLVDARSDAASTLVEDDVHLTDNERRSVLAVYEGYLALPPRYRREPASYRAAAKRIGVEEGKVKADLRRVQEKVARAGGPADGGSRARDALVEWLISRRLVCRADLARLDA